MADVKELNINSTTYDIKAKSIVDTNSGSLKFWSGTKASYDALSPNYDSSTLYFTESGIFLGNTLISNISGDDIGMYKFSSLPQSDAGLHLADGALINGSGIYSAFVDDIADLYTANPSANYFTTEANWQTSVSTYGVCAKYVYDSVNNTVRLPKVTGLVEGTIDVTALGDLVEAGLPNITGTAGAIAHDKDVNNGYYEYTGALYNNRTVSTSVGFTSNGAWQSDILGINASLSNSVYGRSNTVQPQTIKGYLYIVIATTTKTEIEVDIDNVATDLNGKADVDLTNINTTAKEKITTASLPSYTTVTGITIGASGASYTAPADGWISLAATLTDPTNGWIQIAIGSCIVRGCIGGGLFSVFIPVRKGQTYTITYYAIDSWFWAQFITAQGEV